MEILGMLRRYNPLRDKLGDLGLVAIGLGVIVVGAIVRSDFASSLIELLLELIGLLGILGGLAIAIAGGIAYASEKGWLNLPESASGARTVDSAGASAPAESGGEASADDGTSAGGEAVASASGQAGSQTRRTIPLLRVYISAALFVFVLAMFLPMWVSIDADGDEISHTGIGAFTNEEVRDTEDYGLVRGSIYFTALVALLGAVLSLAIRGKIMGRLICAIVAVVGAFALIVVFISVPLYVTEVFGSSDWDRYGIDITMGSGYALAWLGFFAVFVVQLLPMPFGAKK